MKRTFAFCIATFPVAASSAAGNLLRIIEPSADRWMYPSNVTPGARTQASTFSALPGAAGLDDRWGFFLFAFDTGSAVPAGLPPEFYRVRSVKVTAMIAQENLFAYDPTYDPWNTYATPSLPAALADSDAGRPLELHGVGFRNGQSATTFLETSPYGGNGQPGTRSAFPIGFDAAGIARDVSSNVTCQIESTPWAVGKNPDLAPGNLVPEGSVMNFTLDPAMPGVDAYLRGGLSAGRVWFSLSSLHPATQQAGEFVAYYTRDDFAHQFSKANLSGYPGGIAPTLEVDAEISLPLSITRDGGSVFLSWPEFGGFTFTLQASPDLSPGSWQTVHQHAASVTATGTYSELLAPGKRFFRLGISSTP